MKKSKRSIKRKIRRVLMILIPITLFIIGFGVGATTQETCQLQYVQEVGR